MPALGLVPVSRAANPLAADAFSTKFETRARVSLSGGEIVPPPACPLFRIVRTHIAPAMSSAVNGSVRSRMHAAAAMAFAIAGALLAATCFWMATWRRTS